MKTAKNRNAIDRTKRVAALVIIRAYRTVSDVAALMMAKMPPAELIVRERLAIRARKLVIDPSENIATIKSQARLKILDSWQMTWERATKAAWTRELLPDLKRWCTAEVTLTHQLTQDLTGYGSFRKYLHTKRRANTPICIYCRRSSYYFRMLTLESSEISSRTVLRGSKLVSQRRPGPSLLTYLAYGHRTRTQR